MTLAAKITLATALAVAATGVSAQSADEIYEMQFGVFEDAGLWPMPEPAETVTFGENGEKGSLADCPGHPPEYVANSSQWSTAAKQFDDPWREFYVPLRIYQTLAYKRVLESGDCSCASFANDWSEVAAKTAEIVTLWDSHPSPHGRIASAAKLVEGRYGSKARRYCEVAFKIELTE